MKNFSVIILICVGAIWISSGFKSNTKTTNSKQPNIIVILTDDQGFADLNVQGQLTDLKTPHLDKLAETGVRMTSGYVTAPQCIPSRAGILSGKYQQRFGLDHNGTIPFPLEEKMISERMKEAGYVTGMSGKWHLEPNREQHEWINEYMPEIAGRDKYVDSDIPFEKKIPWLPTERGFDFLGYRFFPEELAVGPKTVEHFVTLARHIQIMHNRDKQTSVAPATVKLK